MKKYEYQEADVNANDNKYTKLIKNLEENGIGVEKIVESSRSIGLDLTQFIHNDIRLIEEIVSEAAVNAGITKEIKKDISIADLKAVTEIDQDFENRAQLIYERDTSRRINTDTGLRFRPFLASREEFFKGAFLIENNTEFILREKFSSPHFFKSIFSTALRQESNSPLFKLSLITTVSISLIPDRFFLFIKDPTIVMERTPFIFFKFSKRVLFILRFISEVFITPHTCQQFEVA